MDNSLVEYLRDILRHEDPLPPQDVPVHRVVKLNDKQCSVIRTRGVRVIGDLVRTTAHVSNWIQIKSLNKAN